MYFTHIMTVTDACARAIRECQYTVETLTNAKLQYLRKQED